MSEHDGIVRMEVVVELSDGTELTAVVEEGSYVLRSLVGSNTEGHGFLGSLAESMEHDGLFYDSDKMHDALTEALGYEEDDDFSTLEALSHKVGVAWTHKGFQHELGDMVRDGEVVLKYSNGAVPIYAWKDA